MSSDHIYVRNSEYRTLQNQASRTYQAEQRVRDIQAQTELQIQEARSQCQQRINSMNAQIQTLSNQRRADIKRVRDSLNGNITQLRTQHQQDMQRLDSRISSAIRDYTDQFMALAQKETDRKSRAEIWLTEMSDLIKETEQFQPEKYIPEQYALMQDQIDRARSSYNDGDYEAVRAIVDVNLLQLVTLRHTVQRDKEIFLNTLAHANELTANLRGEIDRLTSGGATNSITYQGETLTRQYDIDYWTNGDFTGFCRQLDQLIEQLVNAENDPNLGLSQLYDMRNSLVAWSGENDGSLQQLDQVGINRHTSQILANAIARSTCDILQNNGYYPVDVQAQIDETDAKPYETILQDSVGNQIALGSTIESNGFRIRNEVYAPGDDNSDSEDTREVKQNVRDAVAEATPGSEITTERRDDCHENRTPQEFLQNTRRRDRA